MACTEKCYKHVKFPKASGCCERFVQDFSKIAIPFTKMTRNMEKYEWTQRCEQASQELKKRVTSTPTLALLSRVEEFMVYNDTSHNDLGCY